MIGFDTSDFSRVGVVTATTGTDWVCSPRTLGDKGG